MKSFEDWRRLVGLPQIGPCAPVWLPRHGLVKRLLQAHLVPLQEVWEMLNVRLAPIGPGQWLQIEQPLPGEFSRVMKPDSLPSGEISNLCAV